MAHNLIETGGVIPMFYASKVKADVWHRLGDDMGSGLTVPEIRVRKDENGNPVFDFDLELQEMFYAWNGVPVSSGRFAIFRPDYGKLLGVCSEGYTVFDQHDGHELAEAVFGQDRPCTTGGVIGGGVRTWLMVDNGEWFVGKGEEMKSNLILSWSHDQTEGIRLLESETRVVCENTLNLALDNGRSYLSIRHDRKLSEKVAEARNMMVRLHEARESLQANADLLFGTPIKAEYVKSMGKRIARHFVPEPKDSMGNLEALVQKADFMGSVLAATDRDSKSREAREKRDAKRSDILTNIIENTEQEVSFNGYDTLSAWALLNGITGWMDHQKPSRGAEGRLSSEMGGERAQVKNWALETILAETAASA